MAKTGRPPLTQGCKVESCERKHYGQGYCRPHYYRHQRTGDPGTTKIGAPRGLNGVTAGGSCEVAGCDRKASTRGLCNAHYLRKLKGLDLARPVRERAAQGAGSRWKNRNGYIILTLPGQQGRIAEHRHVMEKTLGRKLFPDETVHHKNGVRDDNRPGNLELWASTQPSGQRVTDLLNWAYEIVRRYDKESGSGNTGWVAK